MRTWSARTRRSSAGRDIVPATHRTAHRPWVPRLEALEDRFLLATTYYVSPNGDDNHNGTSPTTAWKTLDHVSFYVDFEPGDTIRLQGGASFPGLLWFDEGDVGTAANPITVNSYGAGRATILAGTGYGIFLNNTGGFNISNLNVVGAGKNVNTEIGITLYNTLPGNVELQHVYINNVDVREFGQYGIWVLACNDRSGYNDVRITYARLYENLLGGLSSTGPFYCGPVRTDARVIRNLYVGHVETFNNPGVPGPEVYTSGNGMIFSSLDTAVIERSLAHDNGGPSYGGCGIWVYNSNNVTIQYNESYRNHMDFADGCGFDLDFGTTNSVMQYNYAHDNDGEGFFLVGLEPGDPQFPTMPGPGDLRNRNNVIRYNVSQRNSRKFLLGEVTVYGGVHDAQIYNNTLFAAPNPSGNPAGVYLVHYYGDNVNFRNNIIQTTGTAYQVLQEGVMTGTNVRFQGNAYWGGTAGVLKLSLGGVLYTSLAAWRGAGFERVNSNPVGLNVNPGLTNPGGGGTIGNADRLHLLTAYRLRNNSPLKNAGLNLQALFGVNPGLQDYYGDLIPQGGAFSIGADEA